MSNKYFVIFGGGGIRGLAYCGAQKALDENNINITGCAGSSIGAVYATLYNVGYTYDEIFEIISAAGINLFTDINIDFKKEIAVSKGNKFYDWIKEQIERKIYKEDYKKNSSKPVLFRDLDKKLVIYSVDLSAMKFNEFSNDKTPDFEVAKAVRASVSMPGLFSPLSIDDKFLVDGDLLKSMPLWRASETIKNIDEKIIEFRLEDNETAKKISGSIDYLNRVYNAIQGFATDYIIDVYRYKDKFDYIKIDTPNISVVDFLLPKEKKQELFKIGYKITNEYFKNFYPQKNKELFQKYSKILNNFIKFQQYFNKGKYFECYIQLCEMFLSLCDEKKYIDTSIYNSIVEFKDQYILNYKLQNILGFKKVSLNNKKEIETLLLNIIKILTLKIDSF